MAWKGGERRKKNLLGKYLGPGLVTGASDDDPSGIATYSQAGAAFGLNTLWTALVTYPIMATIQEMCARIGLVTGEGLTGVIKRNYPRALLWLMIVVSFPAITLNIGADLAGMGAVANLLLPKVHANVFSLFFGLLLLFNIIALSYSRIARILKWLCLSLLAYLIVPFLVHQDWMSILRHTLLPVITWDKEYLTIVVGILGTTISPYLFFWQTSSEVEEMQARQIVVDKHIIRDMRKDVRSGIFFSNLVFYFIILSTGTVLHNAGLTKIDTVEEAARALRPLAGEFSYILFALGVIGTGLLAIPVLAGSLSYMISEAFGWAEGLDKKFHEARGFYLVVTVSIIAALAINFTGVSPVRVLIITAVVYGVTAPLLIAIILHICNNRKVMGEHVNRGATNIVGGIGLLLMTAAAILLGWIYFFD
jgi:NRAMP (natural resistance-associated macrophage protein)-like metal ion transporter